MKKGGGKTTRFTLCFERVKGSLNQLSRDITEIHVFYFDCDIENGSESSIATNQCPHPRSDSTLQPDIENNQ